MTSNLNSMGNEKMKPKGWAFSLAFVILGFVASVHAKEDAKELALSELAALTWQDKAGQDEKSPLSWQPLGYHDFTYWGLSIYKASLWLGTKQSALVADVNANRLTRTPWGLPQGVVALSLVYQRGFSKELLVKRSVEEMMAQHTIPTGQKEVWERELTAVLPSVSSQDELVAVYDGQDLGRVSFWSKPKGRLSFEKLGALSDPQLAQSFMGIWLSPQTSQPKMREALLSQRPNKLEARE